jgi:hypothetical protein
MADNKTDRAETQTQLAEDEKFFADTKEKCSNQAAAWAERTRLRSEELGKEE